MTSNIQRCVVTGVSWAYCSLFAPSPYNSMGVFFAVLDSAS